MHQQPPQHRLCVSVPSRALGQWGHGEPCVLRWRCWNSPWSHSLQPRPPWVFTARAGNRVGSWSPQSSRPGSRWPSVLGAGFLGHRLPGKWGVSPRGLHPGCTFEPRGGLRDASASPQCRGCGSAVWTRGVREAPRCCSGTDQGEKRWAGDRGLSGGDNSHPSPRGASGRRTRER